MRNPFTVDIAPFARMELVEPLRSRPLFGALIGVLSGFGFGFLSRYASFDVPWRDRILGYSLGGFAAGLIIGGGPPFFRNRFVASAIVAVATSIGLSIAFHYWHEASGPAINTFLGICTGIVYGVLIWKRPRASSPSNPKTSKPLPNEEL